MTTALRNDYFDFLETDEVVLPTSRLVSTPHLPSRAELMVNKPCASFVIQLQAIERHLISLRQCLQMDNRDGITHQLTNLDGYVDELIPILRGKLETVLTSPQGERVENHLSDIGYPVTLDEGNVLVYITQGQFISISI